MGTATRLTRREKQLQTRAGLLDAALELIAERGVEGATIDEIARHAGYTKGAFYANFASKQELFLTMLGDHFDRECERLDEMLQHDPEPVELARTTGLDFISRLRAEPEWQSLYFQFAAYATRDEEFRRELLKRYDELIDRLERIFARFASSYDLAPNLPINELAVMVFFMSDGFLLHRMLDPRLDDETYGRMVATFLNGTIQPLYNDG